MAIREDIVGLLNATEIGYLEKAEAAGMTAENAYRKIKEFEATYAESAADPIEGWLKGLKYEVERVNDLDAKRAEVRKLEIQLAEKKHLNEGKFLDGRIAELNKALGGGK